MARIDLTEAEQDTLFTAIKALMEKDSKLKVIKAAQLASVAALPTSRQRKLVTIENLPKYLRDRLILNDLLPKDWKTLKRGYKKPDTEESADPRDVEILQLRASNKMLGESIDAIQAENVALRAQPKPPTEIEVIKNFIADILEEVQRRGRAVPGIKAFGVSGPIQPAPPAPKHNPEAIPSGKKLPRVVVLGPKGHQKTELLEEYKDLLDLRIFACEGVDMPGDFGTADHVIGWTKFISHSMEDRVPKDRYMRATTMFGLREMLTALAVGP